MVYFLYSINFYTMVYIYQCNFNILYGRILLAPLEEDCFNWLRFLLLQGYLVLQPLGNLVLHTLGNLQTYCLAASFDDDDTKLRR